MGPTRHARANGQGKTCYRHTHQTKLAKVELGHSRVGDHGRREKASSTYTSTWRSNGHGTVEPPVLVIHGQDPLEHACHPALCPDWFACAAHQKSPRGPIVSGGGHQARKAGRRDATAPKPRRCSTSKLGHGVGAEALAQAQARLTLLTSASLLSENAHDTTSRLPRITLSSSSHLLLPQHRSTFGHSCYPTLAIAATTVPPWIAAPATAQPAAKPDRTGYMVVERTDRKSTSVGAMEVDKLVYRRSRLKGSDVGSRKPICPLEGNQGAEDDAVRVNIVMVEDGELSPHARDHAGSAVRPDPDCIMATSTVWGVKPHCPSIDDKKKAADCGSSACASPSAANIVLDSCSTQNPCPSSPRAGLPVAERPSATLSSGRDEKLISLPPGWSPPCACEAHNCQSLYERLALERLALYDRLDYQERQTAHYVYASERLHGHLEVVQQRLEQERAEVSSNTCMYELRIQDLEETVKRLKTRLKVFGDKME